MPVMGPDCTGAREQGHQVAVQLLAELKAKHKLSGEGFEPFATDFKKAEKQFLKSVEDMFEADVCAWW